MPKLIRPKQLAQRLVTTTGDAVLYTVPNSKTTTYITAIFVCNTTAASKTYSIWVNQNGTVSADQFALFRTVALAANTTDQKTYTQEQAIILTANPASIIVNASVGNALTFTIYGMEIEET